jgi:hypothetical protein
LIYQLLRFNSDLKLVYLILAAVILGSVLSDLDVLPLILVIFSVVLCQAHIRATPFQVSLPVSGRQLFLARMLSILVLLWAPAIVAAIIVAAFRDSRGSPVVMQLLGTASAATLIILLGQSIRIQELETPLKSRFLLLFFIPLFILPLVGGRGAIILVLAICLTASAIVFVYIWKNIPQSFQIARPEAAPAAFTENKSITFKYAHRHRALLLTWLPLFRSIYYWRTILWILFMSVLTINSWLSSPMFMLFLWTDIRKRIRWISSLPISMSAVFSVCVLPILLAVLLGSIVGDDYTSSSGNIIQILPAQVQNWPPDKWGHKDLNSKLNISPPLMFWEKVSGNEAPAIRAPWGETFQPPVVSALGKRVYNPYAVGRENSRRFFDWQLAKATTAVYGRALTTQWISHWPRPLSPPARIQILQKTVKLGLLLLTISWIEFAGWRRIRRFRILFKSIVFSALLIPYIFFLLSTLFSKFNPDLIALGISWALPGNLIAVIAVSAAVPAGLYWLADRLFREEEFVEPPGTALQNS